MEDTCLDKVGHIKIMYGWMGFARTSILMLSCDVGAGTKEDFLCLVNFAKKRIACGGAF